MVGSRAETESARQATTPFPHVLVVGAGQMGRDIAQIIAVSGRAVTLTDSSPEALGGAPATISAGLERMRHRHPELEPPAVLDRIAYTESLVPADLMIEAVAEDQGAKERIFRDADSVLPASAVLASNTSSISITDLAAVTARPDRVIGIHFFNPAPVMTVVELISGVGTSAQTLASVRSFVEALGKWPALLGDHAGFVANRILMPFINEAAIALEEGVADAETIDEVARRGMNHPMGPLELADLIGIDTCVAILEVLQARRGDAKYAPAPLLRRYVARGHLGRKAGRGFYAYDDSDGPGGSS
jgi:3-hydroxybutyryl-CoA dehydrogenase